MSAKFFQGPRRPFIIFLICYVLSQISCAYQEAASTVSSSSSETTPPARIFAPYFATWFPKVSVSQIARASGTKYFSMAFVESKAKTCVPVWSNDNTVEQDTNFPAEISALRQQGGDVIVSFGGAEGHELGQVCDSPASLQAAYQSVVEKLKLRTIDFDIETKAVRDPVSVDRRNAALAALEKANPALTISFTLEVLPTGLTDESVHLLKNAQQHNVRVDRVNILAMDYGPPANPRQMGQNAIDAALRTLDQLKSIQMQTPLGVTVMIGRNDVQSEVFTKEDTRKLLAFAKSNPAITMLSMWSVERDNPCPKNRKPQPGTCSAIAQQSYDFAHIFQKFE